MLGMVFDPRHLLQVCPLHVRVTVSQSLGIYWLLHLVPGNELRNLSLVIL